MITESKFKKSGFSLVELLMVMAIIGILTTIVLNSLSTSRTKAYDSKIKQQLSSFRTAAEMYFNNQSPTGYGPASASCTSGMFNNLDSTNGSPGLYIDPANLPDLTQIFCGSTDSGYAVKATLYSGTGYWCVDNRGFSGLLPGMPTSGTSCP